MDDPAPRVRVPDGLAEDGDGLLYDPRVRALVGADLPPEVLAVVEAFSAIGRAARVSRTTMERWAAAHGLSEARLQILLVLRQQPAGMPLVQLADFLEIAPPSLTGLIDGLEADGLARRGQDSADRRLVRARLTAKGRERVDEIWPRRVAQQRGVTEGIGEAELVRLRHLCLRLLANIKSATAEAKAARSSPGDGPDGTDGPAGAAGEGRAPARRARDRGTGRGRG
ncbi:MarR family winged helix-turn-helix transcriptional regulator [Actinomadura parmotrematis]|uniref:MarR family winged helix-turn-helix transcriptional regulator n=1 Tax=Actinomadura parmotrematis TaxID=2864039 RepID=A0ABS7FVI7_9ACTN|nr:MarR family winged helix-turn-helix transcriptional regulator [Actinomadura parmotrematis]MBW8484301.1 MarR family winged helix-turn-helix transcriptional regulator [Actinomadura parmotrematis]